MTWESYVDYLLIYVILINLIGFFQMMWDKKKAVKNKKRISEKQLFFVAIIGGSVGSIMAMYLFRHKTQHVFFVMGMPLILILQLVVVYLVCF